MEQLEFLKQFGLAFGAIAGVGVLVFIVPRSFAIGKRWGAVEDAVAGTSRIAIETRAAVHSLTDVVNQKFNRFDFILSGADGENGLRGDMKTVKDKVEVLEIADIERRVAAKPRRKVGERRRSA